jgi:hypothetical protein
MKKLLVTLGLALGALALLALPAAAHLSAITASCPDGLSVQLTKYNPAHPNGVTVRLNGSTIADATFGAQFALTRPNPDPTVPFTYQVDVTAWDNPAYDVHTGVVTIPACQAPPTTTVPPTTTTTAPTPTTPRPTPVAPPASPVASPPAFTG